MTPTDTVEQVDRDAANEYLGGLLDEREPVEAALVQAFARHRLATLPDHTRLVEAARKALPLVVGEEEAEELEKALDALSTLET